MGMVYKARQVNLDRLVALKILSPELSSQPAFAERFSREAKALARLHHSNIVSVYDFGRAGPYYYFLMEYVDGVDLHTLIQRKELQAARGPAHRRGNLPGAPVRPRRGDHPPRHQAGEHST